LARPLTYDSFIHYNLPVYPGAQGELIMQRRFISLGLLAILLGFQLSVVAASHRDGRNVRFNVRIENISTKDGFTASNGAKFSVALSPGLWVLHEAEVRLYREGVAAGTGLERQAEDGDPGELVRQLTAREHNGMQHGIFNTPVGASGPGPIGPGAAYEFTITGKPGMKLSMTMMFGQSNDWFYAPPAHGISLFDNGKPISGDVTSKFTLYDAGTEKDEEIGIGTNQGPRQKAPNTGEDEHGVVYKAKSSLFFSKTAELFRVTITPEERM
jgi:hypothetical protein